jgi:hypothetical protein
MSRAFPLYYPVLGTILWKLIRSSHMEMTKLIISVSKETRQLQASYSMKCVKCSPRRTIYTDCLRRQLSFRSSRNLPHLTDILLLVPLLSPFLNSTVIQKLSQYSDGLDDGGSIRGRGKIFFSWPTPGPTHTPIGTGALSSGVKRSEREAFHSMWCRNQWSCTFSPPYVFMTYLIKHRKKITLLFTV